MRRVLVLRPEPGASETAAKARALGLEPILSPLFEVEPVAWQAPDPTEFEGLLLTSANAIRHGGGELQRLSALPAYAVGEATAEAARSAGFRIAAIGNAGVDGLVETLDPGLHLLHLCGEHRREPTARRPSITAIPVYRSRDVEMHAMTVPPGTLALVHSPRAGRRLAELVADRSGIALAAISPAAAEAAGEGWAEVASAAQPTDEALLALAARLCQNRG